MSTQYYFTNFTQKSDGTDFETVNTIPVDARKKLIEALFSFIGSEEVQSASTAFKIGCLAGINWLAITPLNELGYWGLAYFPLAEDIEENGMEDLDLDLDCVVYENLFKVIGKANKLMFFTEDNLDVELGMICIFREAHYFFKDVCEDRSIYIGYEAPR